MTLSNRGRTPGPAGTLRDLEEDLAFSHPEALPRLPGPVGTRPQGPLLWWDPHTGNGSGNAQPSLPTVKLEEPESTYVVGTPYDLVPEIVPLFNGQPKPDDVVQGGLPNCPLHAILVAMAHARPQGLSKMITRTPAKVISTLDKKSFVTNWLITVHFHDAKPIEISTLLYRNPTNEEGDGGDLAYARSDNGVSWVSFFEKAYVKGYSKNSYQILANTGTGDAGKVMAAVVGPSLFVDLGGKGRVFTPKGSGATEEDLSSERLKNILKEAKQRPTIAASPKEVPDKNIVGHHGYGVLGFDGKKVHLRNPWGANAVKPALVSLSLEDFKKNFIVVLQAIS